MSLRLSHLARGTVVYGFGEVLGRILTFLLLPVFTAYLSPADYGVVSIVSTLAVVLTPVFSLGLGAGIAPSYFENKNVERKRKTINTTVTILVFSTTILVCVGVFGAGLWSRILFQSSAYSQYVRLGFITAALTILAIPLRQFLQFEERAQLYVTFASATIVATTCASVFAVVWLRRGALGMLEANLLGQAVALVLFVFPVIRWIRFAINRPLAQELLRLSVPLVPAFAFVFVIQQGSKYVLQWLHGLNEVGVYSLGFSVGIVVNLVVVAFQNAWVPYFMSFADEPDQARIVYGRVLTYYFFGIGALSLSLFAVARPLVLFMTHPAFYGAWRVIGLSATAQALAGAATILLPGMYIAKEVQYIGLLQGTAGAASIVLDLALIPRFGIVGASLALVLSYVLLIGLHFGWNRYRCYPHVQYEWNRLWRFAVFYLLFAMVSMWDRSLSIVGEVGISVILLVILMVGVYLQLTGSERSTIWNAPALALRAFGARPRASQVAAR
jgi:O-antigen/teichoic acid export membrane protein